MNIRIVSMRARREGTLTRACCAVSVGTGAPHGVIESRSFPPPTVCTPSWSFGRGSSLTLSHISIPTLPFPSLWLLNLSDDDPSCNSIFIPAPVIPVWRDQQHHRHSFSCWQEDWRRLVWCRIRWYTVLRSYYFTFSTCN